jgi:hypothetical protein
MCSIMPDMLDRSKLVLVSTVHVIQILVEVSRHIYNRRQMGVLQQDFPLLVFFSIILGECNSSLKGFEETNYQLIVT